MCAVAVILVTLAGTGAQADERVTFPSLDEDLTGGAPTMLEARLYKPEGSGPFPAIVGLHGCSGRDFQRRDTPFRNYADWGERLSRLGYVVLLPDSFRPRGVMEVCTQSPQPVSAFRHRPRDAFGALAWLQQQNYVQRDRVFLMGWSHGGVTVLATLRIIKDETLRARAGGDFRAAVALYPGCGVQLRSRWRTRTPLLILSGGEDDWTPAAPCRELAERSRGDGQPVTYVEYPGAHHGFDGPAGQLRQRTDVPGAQRNGKGSVTVGTDPAAREDVIRRVPRFLAENGGVFMPP